MKILLVIIIAGILTLEIFPVSSRAEKVVTLEAGIEKVIIIPREYDFRSEKEEFASFRRNYLTFWTVFCATYLILYVW